MAPPGERTGTTLDWLVRMVPLLGYITFGLSIIGGCITGILVVHTWFLTLDNKWTEIMKAETEEHDDIKALQQSMIDVDRRINELIRANAKADNDMEAELRRLHNESDAADAQMRARLDVIEALSKFAADRALAPPMPQPYRPTLQR